MSGTKTDLIERLKPFQDCPATPAPTSTPGPAPAFAPSTLSSVPMEVTTNPTIVLPAHQGAPESGSSTSPVSPVPTEVPTHLQDVGRSEAPSDPWTVSPKWAGIVGSPPRGPVPEEKDRRLHEKERQIEELMRKLEQEQRLVEELKMQLEVEKRGQGGSTTDPTSAPSTPFAINSVPSVMNSNVVKLEGRVLSNCSTTATSIPNSILGPQALTNAPAVVKLEDVTVSSASQPQAQMMPQLQQQQPQAQLLTQIQPQSQPQGTASPQLVTQTQRVSQPQRSPNLRPQPQPQLHPRAQQAAPSLQQFFISHQGGMSRVLGHPQTLLTTTGQPQTLLTTTGQNRAQILVPVSLPSNATTIQLPTTTVSLQVCQDIDAMEILAKV